MHPLGAGAPHHWRTPPPPAYTRKGRAQCLYSAAHSFHYEHGRRTGGDPGQPTHLAIEELGWTESARALKELSVLIYKADLGTTGHLEEIKAYRLLKVAWVLQLEPPSRREALTSAEQTQAAVSPC